MYRYIFFDLLTNQPTVELPLFGVYTERLLGRAADATWSCVLGMEDIDDEDVLTGTTPGRTKLVVERNGRVLWCGIAWTRTWQELSETLQFNGQTLESFFYSQYIETNLSYKNVDQRNIVRDLILHMQAKTGADIGIIVPDPFPNEILRTVSFNSWDGWTYGRAIEYMLDYEDGMEFTIETDWDSNGLPRHLARIDHRLGVSQADTTIAFDYPGNIKNFWYPENASRAGVTVVGYGGGEGPDLVRSKYTNSDLLALGYPDLQRAYDNPDVKVLSTLRSKVRAAARDLRVPIVTPTVDLIPSDEAFEWQLGDAAYMSITSRRFPNGLSYPTRLLGFSFRAAEGSQEEQLKLVLPGN